MFIFALVCLLAVGSQAKPLQQVVEPAQHIVIVTPQAQVHLEPAVRYVHGLSPLARVSGPHHEETIVYVPAGAAASVVPTLGDAASTGRASSRSPAQETRQTEGFPSVNQIQQQVQQGVEIVGGQLGEAAESAAAAGAGFFPGFFPSPGNKNEELQKLKNEKIELIETPANTQPLLAATEARHFYSLPQVYHTPVVDVVHTPVYSWPISAIRARSIQTDEAPIQATEEKTWPDLPEPQPLLKEQKQPEQSEQPLDQLAQTIIPAAVEASELKAEIAPRQLEESNAIKVEQQSEENIKPTLKDALQETKAGFAEPAIKEAPKEAEKESIPEAIPEAKKEAQPEARKEVVQEARKEASQEPSFEARKESSNENNEEIKAPILKSDEGSLKELIKETNQELIKEAIKEPLKETIKELIKEEIKEEIPLLKAAALPVAAAISAEAQQQAEAQPEAQPAAIEQGTPAAAATAA
ncbi:eukaryotic translation initiation factor 4 gamma [Drosophila mojavensis]|uniref:DUF4794 domain-containing protein n=1 Tax=Drosophila mojavensis TaxID=7230 RepID=B4KVW0_DROMO|nr:eukaryotic translation initiation factor 4 gamma [Drosophila mojavensis]XP_043865648.1 eukaryotic translation initiation factor 4 gamma [Drosophila mojavensis]EDW18484.1 uncharacterized protein Dmoj_GI12071 [Drosophila mojavensis]